ncbi:glycosyltransferase family 39 protein [Arthrobacter sp. NPDC093128]|uniref:glycosyltransferase family 39 protein n=1 Tax=Arthrobacter sp. NPDC093128 TaxID=3154979 RepID=UPI003446EFFA
MITIDKPPLSIWFMSLSVRVFGLNSWSILVPQALMGVATTWLIYAIIRRSHPAIPALFGAMVYASTPVVVLMSRFNNPEPLMGLLMVASVYFTICALDDGRWRWYLLAGAALGLGFMAKQIQAFLVVPALVVAVILVGAGPLGQRLRRLLGALGALALSGGWWVAVVEGLPAADRPWIGGSSANSVLELTMDYNGLARFIHLPVTSGGAMAGADAQEAAPYDGGIARLFNGNFAPEAGWLLFPAAAVLLILAVLPYLLATRPAVRGLAIISGIWFFTTFLVLSFMGTMIHSYYTYSLGAPVALLLPLGLYCLWRNRERLAVRLIGASIVATSAYMAIRVTQYSDEWPSALAPAIACSGAAAVIGWVFSKRQWQSRVTVGLLGVTIIAGPLASDFHTTSTAQKGTNPISGPIANNPAAISRHLQDIQLGSPKWAQQVAYGASPTPQVVSLLEDTRETWAAATFSAQNAALYQLSSQRPVMAIGGWLGTDPAPDLQRFKMLVMQGSIRYFISQPDLVETKTVGPNTLEISAWVKANFKEHTVDGVRIYDLRQ